MCENNLSALSAFSFHELKFSYSDVCILLTFISLLQLQTKIYKCTWKNCGSTFATDLQVKSHVRNAHLG